MSGRYEPPGLRFYDAANRRSMILVNDPGRSSHGWLAYRHPDGQWVTLREATEADLVKLRESGSAEILVVDGKFAGFAVGTRA